MGRPGARVARKKYKHGRIGFQHKVKKDETVSWFKQRFDGIVGRVSSRCSRFHLLVVDNSMSSVNRPHSFLRVGIGRWSACSSVCLENDIRSAGSDEKLADAMGCTRDVDDAWSGRGIRNASHDLPLWSLSFGISM